MELGLCIEMALKELPFEKRFARAGELGLRNVEMWFVDGSFKGSAKELAKLADDAEVRITSTVIGSPDGGVGGGLTDASKRRQWLERAKTTLKFNREAGIGATIVCTGNAIEGKTDKAMRKAVVAGLAQTAKLAEKAGVTLLLEPLNTRHDHSGYWLTSSDLGAEICREVGSERMKLLFDCYHMQIMEGDIVSHIERNIDVIGHFHAAGVPGRHELFTGEVNYPYVLSQIGRRGYRGVFGLEYAPSMESSESIAKTLEYLKK